jgi:hypothetical protein
MVGIFCFIGFGNGRSVFHRGVSPAFPTAYRRNRHSSNQVYLTALVKPTR